jgi:DNA polymerase alpha subunit B N-terminal
MAMATTSLPADSLDPSLRSGLLEYFPSSLLTPDSSPLLAEILSILRIYNLTPSDLADKWESFCLNKKHLLAEVENGDPFQLENIRELKKHIQESLERESRTKRNNMATPISRAGKMGMADDMYPLSISLLMSFAAISPQTPTVKRKISTPMTVTPMPKSKLADISNITPIASSPLAAKSVKYGT